ncbi:four helix bundle protein [Salinibacter ruber]|uniref:four helix bundle protein n=1 Tax=Salinibacter ruber TaxID=146919 RepID=UPI0021673E2B|nr:four helix bundle protein [Salinibacter ruber]MCS4169890.1 four helix bundle protein [Salinibacter ruber]
MAERFEDLRAWKTARTLTNCVYALTKTKDFENDWALKDQIRRAAISVMSNILTDLKATHVPGS